MRRPRFLVVALLLTWVAALLMASGARAATPACSKFEVGSKKWQDCVADVASGGSSSDKGHKKNDEGDTTDDSGDTGTGCSKFDTGSQKWQDCIADQFSGGGVPNNSKPGTACSEFNVGTKEWQDCIHSAATGGGLMPWIVVIPLGVMMLGMAVMFARQSRRARNFESFSGAQVGSTAGSWLIFMGFIELASGIGFAVAESRASGSFGGYGMAAVAILGVGALMLIIGIVLTIKARGKRQIEETGSPGRATVVRLSQTGTYINENPVFFFELDVNVPGIPQYRTTQKFTVPMYLVQGIGPGAVLPVKVNTSNPQELVVDWSGVSAVRAADPTGQAAPGTGFPVTPGTQTGFPGGPGAQSPFPQGMPDQPG